MSVKRWIELETKENRNKVKNEYKTSYRSPNNIYSFLSEMRQYLLTFILINSLANFSFSQPVEESGRAAVPRDEPQSQASNPSDGQSQTAILSDDDQEKQLLNGAESQSNVPVRNPHDGYERDRNYRDRYDRDRDRYDRDRNRDRDRYDRNRDRDRYDRDRRPASNVEEPNRGSGIGGIQSSGSDRRPEVSVISGTSDDRDRFKRPTNGDRVTNAANAIGMVGSVLSGIQSGEYGGGGSDRRPEMIPSNSGSGSDRDRFQRPSNAANAIGIVGSVLTGIANRIAQGNQGG